ncbi:MAG: PIG-L family deacetylase [Actinomycetota bacterium]|nr:PIG-L family deacetylase [Actinomycetota bacterium]
MRNVEELGTVLGVWAHPDDETYLAGGIMAAASRAGQRVVCVTATAGERGTDDPDAWPPERLAGRRQRELHEALHLLGVHEHHWLGYRDGSCDSVAPEEAVQRLTSIVAAVAPDTILTFGPDGITGHADHIAVGRWAKIAARAVTGARLLAAAKDQQWVKRFTPLHATYDVFPPGFPVAVATHDLALHVELPDDLLDCKVAALQAQDSQTAPIIQSFGLRRWREWVGTEAFVAAPATD